MSNDFQLRKDIDKIDRFVSQLDTAIADKGYEGLDELLEEYGKSLEYLDILFTDMNTLSTDLKELQASLIEFNDALINFSDDNTNFASNLSKLKENLNKVLSQMEDIKEGSAEFSDVLDDLGIDISTFVETLWGLNSDLTILSECLDAFMDDLDGFEDALEDAGIDTTGINEDYAKLVWAVGNVRNRTTTAESNIDDLLDDIGDDSGYNPSTTNPSGIKQWIAWLQYTIGDDTEGEETGLIASILELSNQIGVDDPNNPTGIFADIATINGDINYIDGLINGDANHVGILNQINTINNTDIPAVQQGISNYKTAMFGSSTGSESNYTADSIYGRMYAILHKDSNNNEVGRLPTMESNMTSATNRLDALLDTSVTPNTGRIPDLETRTGSAEGRLDGITNNNGDGTLDVLESKIGNDGSGNTAKTGLYLLIDNVSSTLNNISTTVIGSSSDDIDDGDTTLWAYINQALTSISNAESIIGNNDQYTGADTIWGRIRAYLTRLDNISNTSGTGALDVLEEEVGDVDLADNGTLSNQSLNSRRALLNLLNVVLTGSTVVWRENTSYNNATTQLSSLQTKGLVDTTKLNYIHITTSNSAQLYKRNSSNTGWAYVANYTYEISTLTGHCVGVCYSIDRSTVYTNGEPFDILLELKTNQFYEKSNGNWVATNDISDYFEYIALYNLIDSKFALDTHTHTGWTEVDVKTSGIGYKITDSKFYVNSDLRICELYFKRTGITMSSTYESWGVIPSTYSPKEDLWVATNYSTTGGYIEKTDSSINDYTHIYGNTSSNNTALVFHSMWHY